MLSTLQNFISQIFFDNAFLGTMIASMLPVIEARGAIPLGLSGEFWSTPLSGAGAVLASLLGTSIMTLLLLLITYPICGYLKRLKFVRGFIEKLESKVAKIRNKNAVLNGNEEEKATAIKASENAVGVECESCENGSQTRSKSSIFTETRNGGGRRKSGFGKYAFLCFFTALPIPLTGYYTACLIASFCGMKKLQSFVAMVAGNLICIGVMLAVSLMAKQYVTILFYFFLVVFAATIAYFVLDAMFQRRKRAIGKCSTIKE